jgi:hypothetical protein
MNNPAPVPQLGPDDLFVIACPICRGHVAAKGGLCGRDACCPLCANLFHVPFPATPPATAAPSAPRPALAEDWGGVIEQLAPPPKHPLPKPSDQPAVDAASLPETEPTPLDPAAADLVFREPIRTIRHGNTVIEIRRLTPEERRTRRFRRNLMMIVVGVSILLVIVLLFGVPKK